MASTYDICVDYDTLCEIEYKLELIAHDLSNSNEQMVRAISVSQDFLAGNQFEKARRTTMECARLTEKTSGNIKHAVEYLEKLKDMLTKYGLCAYTGDES